ncbi:SGNH/GDSL hydrolase family protein [Rufibacter sp. LB8]|uniref:SGNH/GDSL hydrolase family protein n=1 Tax=Rufibacter sp. LB8 TaxID=2777781 RepID=UPI00178C6799|nr:SGNH/GDSL hydrolase family protein [Rufibacter sp. LB8]
MKNLFHKIGTATLLSAAFLFAGCEPEFEDDVVVSQGSLDLSKYVAIGNSLTAGYQDNGLYLEGQLQSYPNILANQFRYVGGGDFTQPLFSAGQENGSGYIRLSGFTSSGLPILQPVTNNLATESASNPFFKDEYTGPVQNLGIPGIRMEHVTVAGYGSSQGNPYFERITADGTATNPTAPLQSYVQRVAASGATFFTMWLGNNDVLGYATSGGQVAITSDANFQGSLNAIMSVLPAKGVVINIPDVTSVPFFTTKATAAIMAQAQAAGTRLFITAGDGAVRPATAEDYVLLTSRVGEPDNLGGTQVPHGFTPNNPLGNGEVLDAAEVTNVKNATTRFNTMLSTAATAKNVAYADMNAYFNSIKPGLVINGVRHTPAFITGNIFSLDGVHLTPRGYAIVANELLKIINAKYGATVPTIDVTQFRAVRIP